MKRGIGKSEVLAFIVLAIVGVGLLWPYIFGRRVESRSKMCNFRLTQLGFSIQRAEANANRIPNYRNLWQPRQFIESQGIQENRIVGWPLLALPALGLEPQIQVEDYAIESDDRTGEYKKLFDSFISDYSDEAKTELRNTYLPQLVCPDNPPAELDQGKTLPGGYTSFVANGGLPDVKPMNTYIDYDTGYLFNDINSLIEKLNLAINDLKTDYSVIEKKLSNIDKKLEESRVEKIFPKFQKVYSYE